jgi:drug/metabolite transporter (DMT)-like permease
MFTALRRFSILMTMIGEYTVLGKVPSSQVTFSVFLMVGGAVVAALNDLTFDLWGYCLVLCNDLFTALNGIYLKRATLNGRFSKLGM